ncbi:MAG TPA: class I SAM-dependent methyltransferase [Patescibacteria group bacterium]|nr:class I SAM-dependent methyltransferase [Patescibacteria group bacterium]
MDHHTSSITKKQRTEQEYYNSLVHKKWDNKSLTVDIIEPPFAWYSGDLFDAAKQYMGNLQGKTVLEIGCNNGELSVWFAKNDAIVYGIDISDESIRIAEKRSKENRTEKQTHFAVAPGEKTPYNDNFFDIVFINVSLHHLVVNEAMREIKRILKPNGSFIAVEPFVFSKTIQRIRTSKLVTKLYPVRQETPTERILVSDDLELIQKSFSDIEYQPYRIFSPFIYKIQPLFTFLANTFWKSEKDEELRRRKANRTFQKMDEHILHTLPFLKFLSRYIVFRATNHKI